MANPRPSFSKIGFVKSLVLPALLIFLIPTISYFFFSHAQARFDNEITASVLRQIQSDANIPQEERDSATAFFQEHPFSELVTQPGFRDMLDGTTVFHYATFRWMMRLSAISIVAGVAIVVLATICILLSRRSQRAQYLSLSFGWQFLSAYAAIQTIVQGSMLLALSFWVTALWLNVYIVKLIFIVGVLVLIGAVAVIIAIFKRPQLQHAVEGTIIDKGSSPELWGELRQICQKVGTAEPDQVVLGIDDNFFVTEMPLIVNQTICHGRTLFASLSLLRQMQEAEAKAVLAHEMAHFSGGDTWYTGKTAPLLLRYDLYLQALHANVVTKPIFYFMLCFRALFELSLSRHSRQREFRADRIAVETTSPLDFASALLRISAYSDFRGRIQQDLFDQNKVLDRADISRKLDEGFHDYALSFASQHDIGLLKSSHPYDSHPLLSKRLEAIGVSLQPDEMEEVLTLPPDGSWYQKIDEAESIERKHWDDFESQFRDVHEQILAHRFWPETEEERAVVIKCFPETVVDSDSCSLHLDYESIYCTGWSERIPFEEIVNILLVEDAELQVVVDRNGLRSASVPLKAFKENRQAAFDAISRYYGRHMAAKTYRSQQPQSADSR